MRHTYVCHDRMAGEQCQQFTPLGVVSGDRGELLCSSRASCSTWLGGPEGPAGIDGSVVDVSVSAVAPGVAAWLTAVVAAAAPASAGAAAGREEPVSRDGDAGCVGRSAVGVGHLEGVGLAVGGTVRGAAGGTVAEEVAKGEAWVPEGVEGTAKVGLVGRSEVVITKVAHVVLPSRASGCEPVGVEGSTARPAACSRCGWCFTCGSRLEEIPARAKTLRHASTMIPGGCWACYAFSV